MAQTPRRVLIVGAGAIGTACARRFAAEGARVGVCDLEPSALASAKQALGDRIALTGEVDLRMSDASLALTPLFAALGGADVVIFAAGSSWCGDVLDEDPAVFLELLRTGVLGLKRVAAVAMPFLTESRGMLVVVSGADARSPDRFLELWAVVSGCVQALARCLAVELAEKGGRLASVTVNGVAGGGLDEVAHHLSEALGSEEAAERLLGSKRLVAPPTADEVAETIARLVDAPLFGATIALDGGATSRLS